MYSSAPAMSRAPEELVGHVDRLQRSPPFTHFRLEQGADQLIYRPSAPRRQGIKSTYSSRNAVRLLSSTGPSTACSSRAAQGFNDAAYAESEIMSSIESFSTTGFMSALPAPPRMPARKS
jgi:hypothetical protein